MTQMAAMCPAAPWCGRKIAYRGRRIARNFFIVSCSGQNLYIRTVATVLRSHNNAGNFHSLFNRVPSCGVGEELRLLFSNSFSGLCWSFPAQTASRQRRCRLVHPRSPARNRTRPRGARTDRWRFPVRIATRRRGGVRSARCRSLITTRRSIRCAACTKRYSASSAM